MTFLISRAVPSQQMSTQLCWLVDAMKKKTNKQPTFLLGADLDAQSPALLIMSISRKLHGQSLTGNNNGKQYAIYNPSQTLCLKTSRVAL